MHGIDHHAVGKRFEMTTDTPIRGVSLRHSHVWCKGLKFLDENDNLIFDHTWMAQGDMGDWGPVMKIPEGQRIIGFRAYEEHNCALRIGFILGTSPE